MGSLREYISRRKPPREFLVGIALLLLVVLLWTVASFVVQDALDHGFPKPFWITYINSSSFVVYLIPYVVKHFLTKYGFRVWGMNPAYQPLPKEGPDDFTAVEPNAPFTTKETARLAANFAFPYFAMCWALVASLKYTSVANATILGGTVGFFTLILGRMFRVETMTAVKVIAVTTSFIGIALVSYSDSSTSPVPSPDVDVQRAPILGDILALVSALVGAGYLVLFKHRVPDASRLDMRLAFGFFGLFNLLSVWPIGVFLHLMGWEKFGLPDTPRTVAALIANAAVTVSGDLLYIIAMMKTTPLVASVGQSLTMPLAVLGDFFLHGTASFLAILGCVIVLVSFGVLGLESPAESKHVPLDERRPSEDHEDIEMSGSRRLD